MPDSNGKFVELKEKGLHILFETTFLSIPWLRHGFSTRVGGKSVFPQDSLNLGYTKFDSREAVEANRTAFLQAIGIENHAFIRLRQTHSDRVARIDSKGNSLGVIDADAAITSIPGVVLAVLTADCLPILVVDPNTPAIAAIHAGWRGTAQHISAKTVEALARGYGGSSNRFQVVMGPSIRSCCYEVGDDVLRVFQEEAPKAQKYFSPTDSQEPLSPKKIDQKGHRQGGDKFLLDLVAANLDQLMQVGIAQANIVISPDCTVCRGELYFSHRREGEETGRMMAVIAMVGE